MKQEEYEALLERLDETNEEIMRCREATEWLEEHCQDQNLSANLGLIRKSMARVEYQLCDILKRSLPEGLLVLAEDVPFD